MAETIDELTYDYEEDGRQVRRELSREVLSKGAWSTIMFLFQELDRKTDTWRAPKVAIVRYKKWNGVYRKQSSFNISSEKQGRQIIGALENWFSDEEKARYEASVAAATAADADSDSAAAEAAKDV